MAVYLHMQWFILLRTVVLGAIIITFLFGCTHRAERYPSNYLALMKSVRRVSVLTPEINVVFKSDKGPVVRHDALSNQAQHQVQNVLMNCLNAKNYEAVPVILSPENRNEISEISSLFRNVNRCIQLHTFGPYLFAHKQAYFDYSVGAVDKLLASQGTDAIVLVTGSRTISKDNPKTWLSIAFADATGRIIWYAMQGGNEDWGLKSAKSAVLLMDRVLKRLPEAKS
ncbi:MAG: hypothetical protein GY874_19885 [Desulfobacteraceae bacterium]|nr:hypothetical protein [Desulfobacteraceae bacterium]